MIVTEKIKEYRKAACITQEEVVQRLGLSRPSWIAVEQGRREPSISELQQFAELCDITISDILDLEHETDNQAASVKYRQMILNCLALGSSDGKIPKTKLAKLLYLADFASFRLHGSSMSGLQYRKLPYGPVADEFFRVLDELYEGGQIRIEEAGKARLVSATEPNVPSSLLSSQDKGLLKKICSKWGDKNTDEIVQFTHNQLPWSSAQDGQLIPYSLIKKQKMAEVY